MIGCWTNFAATGNPNGAKGGAWRPFIQNDQNYMVFRLDDADKVASAMGPMMAR